MNIDKQIDRIIGWLMITAATPATLWAVFSDKREFPLTVINVLKFFGFTDDEVRIQLMTVFSPTAWDVFFSHAVYMPLELVMMAVGLTLVVRNAREHQPEAPTVKQVIREQDRTQLQRNGRI